MSAEDVEIVQRWRKGGLADRDATASVLAPDVEWVVPKGTLHGIDEVRKWYLGAPGSEPRLENLDVVEERGELEDVGDGRVAAINKLIYTWKESGEFAYEKRSRLVYTIREGMIVRYELENLPSESEERPKKAQERTITP